VSFLRPTGSQWRTPEYGRSVIISSYRGITRVQRWPRKRGAAKTSADANRRTIFALFQKLIKALGPTETMYAREALAEHNRTHRGQRGSAAIRFRDWQTQRLYGRGIAITTDEGITFWPAAVRRDASFILDHVAAGVGQLLQRNATEWGPIPHGTDAQLLTSQGPTLPNIWQTPAA